MYKVLLVDDEILVREAIGAKIEWNQLGFELAGDCENGKDAIEFVKQTPVDLVLTDICMPYLDGMELSRYLCENHPQTAIIIFSGYGEFEYAKQAIQYKVSEYILKPVTAKELSEVLLRIREKLDRERKQEQKIVELKKVYHSYTKNESLIISKALSRLVQGTQEVETSIRELNEFHIAISGSAYRVVTIDIDVYSELYEVDEEMKKESALMSFAAENISQEIIDGYGIGRAFRDSDNRVCMLLWTNRPREFRQEIVKICQEIQACILDAMKLKVSIGIGCYVDSLKTLPKSYEGASAILKYRYTKGTGLILDCEEYCAWNNQEELKPDFKELASAIREKNPENMEMVFVGIEQYIKDGFFGRNMIVSYFHQLMRAVYETATETDGGFLMPDAAVSAVAQARTFGQAMGVVREYAGQAVESVIEAGQSTGERQAIMALDYLKENYSSPELSLNQICDYVNMSTSRFSSIFKEATGMTFTEALTNIRMEKAKQLLKQTSLKNYEIAEKVGFSDPHYFNIAFKKTTGMTPKRFARENQG